jgi:hypothetical protein
MHPSPSLSGAPHRNGATENSMFDLIMLALGIGGFALLIGYVALCERL